MGRKLPLSVNVIQKKQIVSKLYSFSFKLNQKIINLLEGEFFGEDDVMNEEDEKKSVSYRYYSVLVSSPKTSIYFCNLQV